MIEGDSDSESSGNDSDASEGVRSTTGSLHRTASASSKTLGKHDSMRQTMLGRRNPAAAGDPANEAEIDAELDSAQSSGVVNLHQLNVGDRDTAWYTRNFTRLVHLREVCLSEANIGALPHNIFDKVRLLEKIDLSNNKLNTIPTSIMTLPRLKYLLLDHNQISSVPVSWDAAEPYELHSLLEVGLEWNKLSEFPSHLLEIAPLLEKVFMCENVGIQNLPPLACFPSTHRMEIRLDNRPSLMEQFERGGYAQCLAVNWNKIYPDKVMEYVFLGSLRTAQCVEVYRDLDIKFVLTAGRGLSVHLEKGMDQLELPVDDVPGADISGFFDEAFQFIDKARSTQRGVLIHCFAGLSRSVTVMVAYLMKFRGLPRDAALEEVRRARPNACPNDGFMVKLTQYEGKLRQQGFIK